jgi:hypothetical protein
MYVLCNFDKKMGSASFWAILSQTLSVSLMAARKGKMMRIGLDVREQSDQIGRSFTLDSFLENYRS